MKNTILQYPTDWNNLLNLFEPKLTKLSRVTILRVKDANLGILVHKRIFYAIFLYIHRFFTNYVRVDNNRKAECSQNDS